MKSSPTLETGAVTVSDPPDFGTSRAPGNAQPA